MKQGHPIDLLPAYALGCLDADEYEQVREHLRSCSECRAELSSLEAVNAQLAYAAPPVLPSEALKLRVLSGCHPHKTFLWVENLLNLWPRLIPAVTVAAYALVAVFGISSFMLWQQLDSAESEKFSGVHVLPLHGTETMPGAEGSLIVDPDSGQGLLVTHSLQPLEASLQYQLWLIQDGQRTSGGVFSVADNGSANLIVSSAEPFSSYDSFGITIEPFGGSSSPTGKKVLGGKMVL